MNWLIISSLKAGMIHPPRRLSARKASLLDLFNDQRGIDENSRPMTIEQLWRHQGLSAGYIKVKLKKRREAA